MGGMGMIRMRMLLVSPRFRCASRPLLRVRRGVAMLRRGAGTVTDDVVICVDMRKALPRDVEGVSVRLPKGKKSGRDVITYP